MTNIDPVDLNQPEAPAPVDLTDGGGSQGSQGSQGSGSSGGQLPGTTFSLVSSPSVVTNGNSSVLIPYFYYINIEYAYIGTGGEDSSDISSSVSSGTAITVTPGSSAITTYTLTVAYTRYANIYDTVGTLVKRSVTTNVETVSAATLTSLTASPTNITTGDSTVLTGVFSNGTGIITRNTGTPIFLSMTSGVGLTVYPSVTTTYTLTVTNLANDQVTENVTVTVGAAPSAVSLVPTASSINYGASTTLTPTFSGGTGVVTPGSISVTSGTPITVSPTSTTTYTLTVTNSAGLTSTTTGTVTVVALPVATSLTPGSSSITSGSSTTLTPTFSNGTAKIGTTAGGDQITSSITSGTAVTISPTSTTTYYLTVTNSLGTTASTSTVITVIGVPVATSLAPGTATLTNGDSTTLIPIFSGGTGTVSPTVGSVTSGNTYTVSPTTTTTYTLTVTNTLGASTTTSSTITVIAAPSPTANPIEFYVRNPNNQPSKVKEFYLMDSAKQWRLIKEGWFFDGSAWRQIFKYDPSIIVVSNNPVKPVSADESGFTGSGESKSNKNNSFDTATISDSTTHGEWIANGTIGNTITWTWDNTTPSPAYTTISFNARIQILNFTTAVNSGQGDCKRYDCCDENGDRYCAEWAPAFAPPSSILFEYTLNGQNPSPTWVSFQGFLSSVDSSFTGTVYSSDITSGIPSNISNLKIRATVSCPTGDVSNGTATLRVYDVWISTVSGSAAVPPTITSFAPVNNLITTGSNGALVSIFSPNGGATISSATISENGSTIATLSTSTGSNTITTTIATPSSGTHTYTLTVTDSNSNTSSKDTTLSVAGSLASSPSILLSYFNNSTNAFTTPSNNVTNFKLDPNKEIIITASFINGVAGQSVVSVTSGSASDAGLPSPWTPSSSPGYYYIIPKAVGSYTFTNTLNGGSPTATATLQVVEAEPTPINATSYNPISKNAALYREYEYVNGTLNTLTPKAVELSIVCNFTVQNYSSGTVVAKWQRKENISDSWVDYQTSDFTNLLASLIVTQLGYYRIKITNTIGSTTVTTYSDEFTVVQRDRIRPSGSFSEVIKPIGYISQGNPGILTLESRDLSLDGLSGVISITDTLSMYQLNGRTVTLTEVETNFSLKGYRYALSENGQNLNTSNFNPFRYVSPSANGIITIKDIWDVGNKAADWLTVNSATGSIVTTTTPHGFSSGQKVLFTNILGLIELNSQILTIQGITDDKTFTINLPGAARPYNENYKGYVIGVDTFTQAPPSILMADPNDSADFLYAEETVSLNFPRLDMNGGSMKLYLRAGFEYSSGPGTFEGNTQYLSLVIKNKGIDVGNIINVTMPNRFDGYSESSPWSFGPQNTIENRSIVIDSVENLNDISIVLNSAGGTENRIIEDPENPITYQSGNINIYDCYAIIRPGITSFDPYDADTIYPPGS